MTWEIRNGDCLDLLRAMPDESVQCVVTSPPYYGLRDYGLPPTPWPEVTFCPVAGLPEVVVPPWGGCLGLEADPWAYVAHVVAVFREVGRVLRRDGVAWLNLGDSYAGSTNAGGDATRTCNSTPSARDRDLPAKAGEGIKPKDLLGVPWRVAFALQADGWYLRSDVIWAKPSPMPESVTDRPTKAHEYLFLLAMSERYFYDARAAAEEARHAGRVVKATGGGAKNANGGPFRDTAAGFTRHDTTVAETRNRRTVWTVNPTPFAGAHFATMPPGLVEPCILAGCPVGGVVLDPFAGAGTVGLVASRLGRSFVGLELNPDYATMARRRIADDAPLLNRPAEGAVA